MNDQTENSENRVLVVPPTARDGEITHSTLSGEGIVCVICPDLHALCLALRSGAGALIVTNEVLATEETQELLSLLEAQPAWSDLPVILLMLAGTQSSVAGRVIRALGNVTLLERPAPMRSLVSAVQTALRGRQRQYQIRDQILTISGAEARSRELQQQLEVAIEASELGTFHCEMPLGKIIWNDRCKAHFWLPSSAEISFELFYSILHPDDRERTRAAVEACVYGKQGYDIEYRTVSPQGDIRWVCATGRTLYDEHLQPLLFDGTTQDITARKLADEQREQLFQSERAARAEAENAGRMKDEFLATLSHELRTPLNAILGWSQLIRADPDKETLTEGLAVIERNARVQVQLIEDLLDMSRIISGKIRLDIQQLDPISFIEAAIETVLPGADAKGIRLQKVLAHAAGPISGDPGRLQQVVWNLLSNAIKFTPKGGRIQVVLKRSESVVQISVADNGKGINPEFLPHVFERFRQADPSTTRLHGGLGLGLSIVKHLVELHGGAVEAQSDGENEGSIFVVSLPLTVVRKGSTKEPIATARHSLSPSFDPSATSLEGLRVMVVDDEPDARDLVRRVLEGCDASVVTAGSAAEALDLLASEKPDVLVSDIGMPRVDGYELLRQIRSLGAPNGGNIPAIALSAFARSEDRTRAQLAGFTVHIAKPVEPQELIATVASIAGRTGARAGA